jgi:tetratricopeptide (TPR) repeat protein
MDTDNAIVKLCIQGTQAEFKGNFDEARSIYRQAWEAATTDYEACIAAHYIGHIEEDPETALSWHLEALKRASAVSDDRARDFYPSLYVNLGHSYEQLGNPVESERYYKLAADLGVEHQLNNINKNRPAE